MGFESLRDSNPISKQTLPLLLWVEPDQIVTRWRCEGSVQQSRADRLLPAAAQKIVTPWRCLRERAAEYVPTSSEACPPHRKKLSHAGALAGSVQQSTYVPGCPASLVQKKNGMFC
jgi:hypothetical protein